MSELAKDFWELHVSTEKELEDLEKESYRETKLLYVKYPEKAKEILSVLVSDLDLMKILYDMYVWQRVDSVKMGIEKAQSSFGKGETI